MKTEYYKAYKLNDALDKAGAGYENPKFIAGGTDIVIDLRNKKIKPDIIIDISDTEELKCLSKDGLVVEIGASTTFTEIENMKLGENLKGLTKAASSVGSPQIRNRGTIGGNICNGSPAADTVPPLLALDSLAVIDSKRGRREIALENIFLDKGKTVLDKDEILTKIKFKKLGKNEYLSFSKLGLRNALAISRICTAVYIKVDKGNLEDIRIANGALGKYGIREKKVEDSLKGRQLNEELIDYAMKVMSQEVEERLKGRSSLEFKSEAVKGTINKALFEALNYFLRKAGV